MNDRSISVLFLVSKFVSLVLHEMRVNAACNKSFADGAFFSTARYF